MYSVVRPCNFKTTFDCWYFLIVIFDSKVLLGSLKFVCMSVSYSGAFVWHSLRCDDIMNFTFVCACSQYVVHQV